MSFPKGSRVFHILVEKEGVVTDSMETGESLVRLDDIGEIFTSNSYLVLIDNGVQQNIFQELLLQEATTGGWVVKRLQSGDVEVSTTNSKTSYVIEKNLSDALKYFFFKEAL